MLMAGAGNRCSWPNRIQLEKQLARGTDTQLACGKMVFPASDQHPPPSPLHALSGQSPSIIRYTQEMETVDVSAARLHSW